MPGGSPSVLGGIPGCVHWMAGFAGEQAGGHESKVRSGSSILPCALVLTPVRVVVAHGSESLADSPPLDAGAVQVPSAQVLSKALLSVASPAMAVKAGVCARIMLAAHHRCVVPGHQKDSVWKVGTYPLPPVRCLNLGSSSHVSSCVGGWWVIAGGEQSDG